MSNLAQLTLTALPNIPLIQPGDDLCAIVLKSLAEAGVQLQENDVLIVAQKIVSKAEGRLVRLSDVIPSARALELAEALQKDPRHVEVILQETKEIVRMRPGVIVVEHRLGYVCANAGVDRSNVAPHGAPDDDCLLMLPEAPDRSCAELRRKLREATGVNVGVIVNDSHGRAWRTGTVGVALGAAGVPALLDLRGTPDLFDYPLQVTQVGFADELAAAASLLMGQAAEGRPVIHARGVPYPLREGNAQELIRTKELDLFR
ncbi:MAG: coenzyme F420-0:L-glutamate ligase [Chloroflexi bacterium]|nr:coenzyme F420-0:L-glutamate ligase [Chloroflexota bacterium]